MIKVSGSSPAQPPQIMDALLKQHHFNLVTWFLSDTYDLSHECEGPTMPNEVSWSKRME